MVEFVEGTNYTKFALFADAMVDTTTKVEVKSLLGVSQSDCECKLIYYTVIKASGVSYTAAIYNNYIT